MNLNRRNFLFGSAAAATFAGCSTGKMGLRPLAPGEKRTVAMIGIGIQGRTALLPQFLKCNDLVKVVAVCDCDKTRCEDAKERVDKFYKDGACLAHANDDRNVSAAFLFFQNQVESFRLLRGCVYVRDGEFYLIHIKVP